MRWEGQSGSENVEDRRGVSPSAVVGGGGFLAVIVAVIFTLMSGGTMQQAVNKGIQTAMSQKVEASSNSGRPVNPDEDKQAQFASVVLKYTEEVWDEQLPQLTRKTYQKPSLILFRDGVRSACGHATAAVGPFYCPGDSNIYLDLSFFEEMRTKFKAPGDFACAYVIAHEVGHHIQNLLGLSMKVQSAQAKASKVESNNLSVRLELQADFLAGVWAHHAQKKWSILETGDIEEAIRAAQAIGDDTLMKNATGRVVPDAFTHGSAEQRIRWFTHGLKSGDLQDLNMTFEMEYDRL